MVIGGMTGRAGMKWIGALAAAVAVAAPVALAADGSERGKPKSPPPVEVGDDFYSPINLSVKSGTKVKFKWLPDNLNPHNVTLRKGPSGVKKKEFESPTGSIGVKYAPTFEKKGTYDLLCTIHPDVMKMKVTVKK